MTLSTDLFVILALGIFFFIGWRKGFLLSIIGPISLIVGSIISVQYYYKNQDIVMSLVIGIVGPFAINIIISLLLKVWKLTTPDKQEMSTVSRALGGSFSVFWRGTLLILTLILLAFLPESIPYLGKIQRNVTASQTYTLVTQVFENANPEKSFNIKALSDLIKDPEKRKELSESEEFNELVEDDTFKELFSDKEFLKAAEEQDFAKLLTHPNMQKILTDKNLVQKLMSFQKQLIEQGFQSPDKK